ncbi:hypothetical protein JavanS627_0001 [Streptococcus satellite phage Javan627]|uniref:hypothetical protein n=1 Tax=Streptococcus uberis TaxID=1349 RepID=UPI00062038A9|nr:hypothetical protein [Streptococcus uberis]KKF46291.1 hypothetical protein AF59_02190 [Streptococcus uberis C5072]QBX12022.1 hypothetical protein JavanS627_0001 [Streptococcus satellite phage Javan627]
MYKKRNIWKLVSLLFGVLIVILILMITNKIKTSVSLFTFVKHVLTSIEFYSSLFGAGIAGIFSLYVLHKQSRQNEKLLDIQLEDSRKQFVFEKQFEIEKTKNDLNIANLNNISKKLNEVKNNIRYIEDNASFFYKNIIVNQARFASNISGFDNEYHHSNMNRLDIEIKNLKNNYTSLKLYSNLFEDENFFDNYNTLLDHLNVLVKIIDEILAKSRTTQGCLDEIQNKLNETSTKTIDEIDNFIYSKINKKILDNLLVLENKIY